MDFVAVGQSHKLEEKADNTEIAFIYLMEIVV